MLLERLCIAATHVGTVNLLRSSSKPLMAALAAVFLLCSCQSASVPSLIGPARFTSCTIGYYDTTVAAGATSRMRGVMDEVTGFTHVKFQSVSKQSAIDSGLIINLMTGGDPAVQGKATYRYYLVYSDMDVVQTMEIDLRSATTIGIKRHEMGHLFDLAHNPSSPMMRPAPADNAAYSAAERNAMIQMSRNTGCI